MFFSFGNTAATHPSTLRIEITLIFAMVAYGKSLIFWNLYGESSFSETLIISVSQVVPLIIIGDRKINKIVMLLLAGLYVSIGVV